VRLGTVSGKSWARDRHGQLRGLCQKLRVRTVHWRRLVVYEVKFPPVPTVPTRSAEEPAAAAGNKAEVQALVVPCTHKVALDLVIAHEECLVLGPAGCLALALSLATAATQVHHVDGACVRDTGLDVGGEHLDDNVDNLDIFVWRRLLSGVSTS
jgi:hypothetical protein